MQRIFNYCQSCIQAERQDVMSDRDALAFIFLRNGGFALKNDFIYDTTSGKPLEFKGRLIGYPPEKYELSTDVVPFDMNKASRLAEWMFSVFCQEMYYFEEVDVRQVALFREPGGSKVSFCIEDATTREWYTTPLCKTDAIAYTYAMALINGNDCDTVDLDGINARWVVM